MKFAANWKLNCSPAESRVYLSHFSQACPKGVEQSIIFFPPASSWEAVSECLASTSMAWGGQNVCEHKQGAFTGENSAQVLKALGGQYCLIGHSERRHLFGETDELLARKAKLIEELDIIPVLCVGETLEQKEKEKTLEVLRVQLTQGLSQMSSSKHLVVAYEPVWAIGTGLSASSEEVSQVHMFIRSVVSDLGFSSFEIWYGGSVKANNVSSFSKEDVQGFLVGSASLDPQEFAKLISRSLG